jgi:hypothetical protein
VSRGSVELFGVDAQPILGRALGGFGPRVAGLGFSPDGRALDVARGDGSATVWSDALWNPDRAIGRICAILGRPLRAAEWRQISPDEPLPRTC